MSGRCLLYGIFGGSLRDACAACSVGAIIRALVFLLDRPQIMPMFSNTLTSFLAGLTCIAACSAGHGTRSGPGGGHHAPAPP